MHFLAIEWAAGELLEKYVKAHRVRSSADEVMRHRVSRSPTP